MSTAAAAEVLSAFRREIFGVRKHYTYSKQIACFSNVGAREIIYIEKYTIFRAHVIFVGSLKLCCSSRGRLETRVHTRSHIRCMLCASSIQATACARSQCECAPAQRPYYVREHLHSCRRRTVNVMQERCVDFCQMQLLRRIRCVGERACVRACANL